MKTIATLFAVPFASPLFADVTQLVREGVALYDQGRWAGRKNPHQAAMYAIDAYHRFMSDGVK